jgi:CRP-like cAMP-binding protein
MSAKLGDALPTLGRNAMLDALRAASQGALDELGTEVELDAQDLVEAEEEGARGVYFPISCMLCRLVSLPEGTSVKVSLVGREGMAGLPAVVRGSTSVFRTVVQIPGRAWFIPARDSSRLLVRQGTNAVLLQYASLLLREASLTAACNQVHSVTQRLARWLLLIRDRSGRDEFRLTHESLSSMLGVRRETVTASASKLRSGGSIEYHRAMVTIANRAKLVAESCSCYEAVTANYIRFLRSELSRRP